MELITKLEVTLEGFMKSLPHLPLDVRKWIARNAWILNLIGLIACVVIVLFSVGALIIAYLAATAMTSYIMAYGIGSYSITMMIASIVSILSLVIAVVLTAMAIKPLKAMNKKGWDLLFLAEIVTALFSIIGAFVSFNMFSFIPNIIFTGIGFMIGAYFLFEIRSYFTKSGKDSAERKTAGASKTVK